MMNPEKRRAFFEQLKANNPKPETELEYSSPFELLIAVLLSAQATDISVNKGTRKLYKVANTPQALLALGEEGVRPYIQHIGLFNSKGKHIQETCKLLLEKHGGEVPQTREELEVLPGVGRKTANVVLNAAFNKPTIAVDTHVFRVGNRTGLSNGKDPEKVENQLLKILPTKHIKKAHNLILLHGRYICKARNPLCKICVINKICLYKEKYE